MGLPRLDLCCCGCTTKTGSRIILCLTLIVEILRMLSIITIQLMYPPSSRNQTWGDTYDLATDIATIWFLIDSVIWVVIVIIAIHGVEKRFHWYLVPYLTWTWIELLITLGLPSPYHRNNGVLGILIDIAIALGMPPSYYDDYPVLRILIGFVIMFYFWLVICSYYRDLKKRPITPSTV